MKVLNEAWPSNNEPVQKELLRAVWAAINKHLAPNVKGVLTLRNADFDPITNKYIVTPGITPTIIEVVDALSRDVIIQLDKDAEDLFQFHAVFVRYKATTAGRTVYVNGYNQDGLGSFALTTNGHWVLVIARDEFTYEVVADNATLPGGGASTFLQLTDTIASYVGLSGQFLKVKADESGIETGTPAGGGDMQAATYDPNNRQADVFDINNLQESVNYVKMLPAERTKLGGIQPGAQVNPSSADIAAGYHAEVPLITLEEGTLGTQTATRRTSPSLLKQIIEAIGGAGGGNAGLNPLSDIDFIGGVAGVTTTVDANNSVAIADLTKSVATGSTGWTGSYTFTLTGDCPASFSWMFFNNSGFPQTIVGPKVNTYNGNGQPAVIPHDCGALCVAEGDTELKIVAIFPVTPFALINNGGRWLTVTGDVTLDSKSPGFIIIPSGIAGSVNITFPAPSDGLNFEIYNVSPSFTANIIGGVTSAVGPYTSKKYVARSTPTAVWQEVGLSLISIWDARVTSDYNPTNFTETAPNVRGMLEGIDNKIGTLGVGGSGVITVANIAALKALEPNGSWVHVLGYFTPGDGGGGVFYGDTASGRGEDGGTVFGFNDDISVAVTTQSLDYAFMFADSALPAGDIVFDTVAFSPDETNNPFIFDAWDLCGHQGVGGSGPVFPVIDMKQGIWYGSTHATIRNYITGPTPDIKTATLTYKTFTDARRWVRIMPGNELDVRWFGAQPTQNAYDTRNRICWALNAAKLLGRRIVRLNGDYEVEGTVEIPNKVFMVDGKFKLPDGRAVPWLKSDYTTTNPFKEKLVATGGWTHGVTYEDGASEFGLIRFEYDGNFEGNLDPCQNPQNYTDPYDLVGLGTPASLGMMLQNTQVWTALNFGIAGGREPAVDQVITLEDVHAHGTGSNVMGNDARAYIVARNLRLGNSVRNHLFYNMSGEISGLTIYGFAYGSYGKTEGCNIHGFNVEQLVDGKATHGWDAANLDGGWNSAPTLIQYEGQRWGAAQLTGAEYNRWGLRKGLNINGFNINLEGFPATAAGPLFTYTGTQFALTEGTILGPFSNYTISMSLIAESLIGGVGDLGLYSGISVRHVRLIQRGQAFTLMGNPDLHADQSGFEDISIEDERGFEDTAEINGWPMRIIADTQARTDPKYSSPRQVYVTGVTAKPKSHGIAFVDVLHENAHPIDVHFTRCVFPLVGNTIFKTNSGSGGTISGMTVQNTSKIKVFMDRCRFTLGADTAYENCELFFAIARLSRCATIHPTNPLTSEAAGVYTASGAETPNNIAKIQTKLAWAPRYVFIKRIAGVQWQQIEVRNSDGSALLNTVANKSNPQLWIYTDTPLSLDDTIEWVAAIGGPEDGSFIEDTIVSESGSSGDMTGSEILTALLSVDGVGSGLDADLLDGQQGSHYATAAGLAAKQDASTALTEWSNKARPAGLVVGTTDNQVLADKTLANVREIRTVPAISAGAVTIDYAAANVAVITLNANITNMAFSNIPLSGSISYLTLWLVQDGTGGRTVTWPASVDWGADGAPTIASGANEETVITLLTRDGGTSWKGMLGWVKS